MHGNTSLKFINAKQAGAIYAYKAPDDGHCNARNMLSSVCTTKQ